jgi:hypothetical protein
MSRTDLVHTRLARHNWVLAEKSGEKYLYRRGDHWIQLDPDGCGYHGYQDRRVSNGTHESIVARFGETPPLDRFMVGDRVEFCGTGMNLSPRPGTIVHIDHDCVRPYAVVWDAVGDHKKVRSDYEGEAIRHINEED